MKKSIACVLVMAMLFSLAAACVPAGTPASSSGSSVSSGPSDFIPRPSSASPSSSSGSSSSREESSSASSSPESSSSQSQSLPPPPASESSDSGESQLPQLPEQSTGTGDVELPVGYSEGGRVYVAPQFEGSSYLEAVEAEVILLINKERKSLGLNPLTYDKDLALAARVRSAELYRYNYFGHHRHNGDPWETVLQIDVPVDYTLAAENLAWSNRPADEEVSAYRWFSLWKSSPDHYAQMIYPEFTSIGVGILTCPLDENEGESYATALFCKY